MRTIRREATRRNRWLTSLATAALLVGCGGPYGWNEYLDPAYAWNTNGLVPVSSLPAQVSGTVGSLSPDELRSLVADGIQAPIVRTSASAAPQQGSSAPEEPATRTVWTFSSTPAPGGGMNVHVKATYYRDNTLISIADGTGIVANAGDTATLRQIVANTAAELVPVIEHRGNGHS